MTKARESRRPQSGLEPRQRSRFRTQHDKHYTTSPKNFFLSKVTLGFQSILPIRYQKQFFAMLLYIQLRAYLRGRELDRMAGFGLFFELSSF